MRISSIRSKISNRVYIERRQLTKLNKMKIPLNILNFFELMIILSLKISFKTFLNFIHLFQSSNFGGSIDDFDCRIWHKCIYSFMWIIRLLFSSSRRHMSVIWSTYLTLFLYTYKRNLISFYWLMFKFSSPRDTNDIIKECCCLISSIKTIFDLVSLKELKTRIGGIVAKKKIFKIIKQMKNA